jgi:N-acetylglutamate synthase-like GNAT family acetyltransferase
MPATTTTIRRATTDDACALTELTIRSKAHWGYDADFLRDARADLEFQPDKFLPDFHVYILEENGRMLGFCSLIPGDEGRTELHDLFVAPDCIGKGFGKQLWDHALQVARSLGFRALVLTADPNAEPFYARQGAVRLGEKTSPVRPDRRLPIMEFVL